MSKQQKFLKAVTPEEGLEYLLQNQVLRDKVGEEKLNEYKWTGNVLF